MTITRAPSLYWLPPEPDWRDLVRKASRTPDLAWADAVALAKHPLDFLATNMLDTLLCRRFPEPPAEGVTRPVRLAVLGSATTSHLHAGIRVAGLRRGFHVASYETGYGQYRQELADRGSGLHAFAPDAALFVLDPWHMTAGVQRAGTSAEVDAVLRTTTASLVASWRQARETLGCRVLQQAILPVFDPLLGSNEQRLPGSRADFVRRLNDALRGLADAEKIDLVAVDQRVAVDGIDAWHDIALWHRSKQEISPAAVPMYGELVGRIMAAMRGRASKCLVLDLDNTIWGGVIGDDGVAGVQLGQGSGIGEAFVAVQDYAKALSRRGVILAVVSKNDEANALEAFDRHPEMVLKREDIGCFVANWSDKASNLRAVAEALNIGLDSLVFLDDNPFERNLVRQELPMVAVPEVPDDPALFPRTIADAGYFEAVGVTEEDFARRERYQASLSLAAESAAATDLPAFLRSLDMTLFWRRVDRDDLPRIVQLANKTNQFNLMTRRYDEADAVAMIEDEHVVCLRFRLTDKYGDNGTIALVVGRLDASGEMIIESWLMSCRVLGRGVEPATLNILAAEAAAMGATALVGEYRPTAKNGMVRDHYAKLGFDSLPQSVADVDRYRLSLDGFRPRDVLLRTERG